MKKIKYITVGILIGAFMSFAFTAVADTVSLIGKKIGGEAEVLVDGEYLDTAILVNGKSYAPVRSIAEAAGFEVDFIDRKVVLETPKEGSAVEQEDIELGKADQLRAQIEAMELDNAQLKADYISMRLTAYGNPDDAEIQKQYQELDKKIQELDAEYQRLKAELAELEASE